MESCEVCGFEWDAVGDDLQERIVAGVDAFAAHLRGRGAAASVRPEPEVWSALEYGCHVRDVLHNVRDRLVLAAVVETPDPPPLYRDDRVRLGLYEGEDPAVVADELALAGRLFARTVGALAPHADRLLRYAYPRPADRTIRWAAAQALHEVEHHLGDIRA
jgi:hypothetical protein